MKTFIATDLNYHSCEKIYKILSKETIYFIRDLSIDIEIRNNLLQNGFSVVQCTLTNKTPSERIESILNVVDDIIIFTNDIKISKNRFFIGKKKNVTIYDMNLNEITENIIGTELYEEESESEPRFCNFYQSEKKIPKTIKIIDHVSFDNIDLIEPKKMKKTQKRPMKKKEVKHTGGPSEILKLE